MKFLFSALLLLVVCPATFAIDKDPVSFAFGIDAPPEVQGSPGEVKTFDVFATLTTKDNTSPDGAQAWVFGMLISKEATISKVAIKGLTVSTIYDEDVDQDPGTPPVHHDPYFQDLGAVEMFTKIAKRGCYPFAECTYQAAFSAVVFRSQEKMVLQPNGIERIARITIQVTVPKGPDCLPVRLWYQDGVYIGSSQPVANFVTFEGRSVKPEQGSTTILVCPTPFRRGDSNSDGGVDISDAIASLAFLYLGGRTPGCMQAADANDDGQVDLSDPVFTLLVLFNPEVDAQFPMPGAFGCGPDPSPDSLSCFAYPACS